MTAIRVSNLKQMVALSSIAHMSIITLGLFSQQTLSIAGSLVGMISHSLVSSVLFILCGILYSRVGSYELNNIGGLGQTMPLFSFFFIILNFANLGLPITINFVGEVLTFISLGKFNALLLVFAVVVSGLNVCYTLWFLNRVVFNDIVININECKKLTYYQDLTRVELGLVVVLTVLIVLLGLAPKIFLSFVESSL